MDCVYKNQFGEIVYNPSLNILEVHWNDSTDDLSDEGFQAFLLKFTEVMKHYTTSAFFVDATKKLFVMSNSIQEWHDEVIIPKYVEAGITKIAFWVADNTMVDISLELTFDEENSKQLTTRFFSDEAEAKIWIEKGIKDAA